MGRVTQNVPEKELPVQITDVNGIHVNDMDVLEPWQCEIGENLTTKATCTDDEDFAFVP